MVTSRSVAVLAPATLLALAAILASSCDLLSGDIFPSWLPYVEARADLAAAAAEAGIGTLRNLDTVEYVSFTDTADADKSKILAYLRGLDGEALVAFEPAGMGFVAPWVKAPEPGTPLFALGPRIIQTSAGFTAGQLAFNLENMNNPEALPVQLSNAFSQDGIVLAIGSPIGYFQIRAMYDDATLKNRIEILKYDDSIIPGIPTARLLELAGRINYLVDAQYYENADLTEGVFRILVKTDTGVQAFSFASDAALVLAPDAPEITGPVPMSDSTAWLTADGVVTINHNQNTYLARYAYGWTVADVDPTDTLQLTGNTEAYQIMSFDASGTWWFLYDRLAQQLYALRTWW